jgi:phenylacetate-CoA ligase
MLDRLKFVAAHEVGHGGFYPDYRRLKQNEHRPLEALKAEQMIALRRMLQYAGDNVPYYHRLFRILNFDPASFRNLDELQHLPILTKEAIKKHYDELVSSRIRRIPHIEETTGGSTGTPMKYLVSQRDRLLGGALLYRGWGYAGYELGDRMVFLAGMSLGGDPSRHLLKSAHEFFRNIRKLSTLNMGEQEMRGFIDVIDAFQPRFIRGYASSVYAFARWAQHNDVRLPPAKAVFTTSEKLYPRMRDTIASVFGGDVFDGYGLYDGGLTAFECADHKGMHIDMERSVMELVDDDGQQLESGQGRIIATGLANYAMPLIRYDTDDIGIVSPDPCPCGRPYPLLREICGRSGDFLYTPEGRAVHSLLFAYIFDELPWVKEYQVVQERLDRITIRVIPDVGFDERKLDNARTLIQKQSEAWNVDFSVVSHIEKTRSGKYKYIINNMINNQN